MKKIAFDSGVQEYRLGSGGILRFNPGDPNLYARFLEALQKLEEMEQTLLRRAQELKDSRDSAAVLALLTETDRQIKQLLGWVFGADNDMDAAVGGVNLLAVATNGERVVTNLVNALQPILAQGAQQCAREKTEAALAKARQRRSAQ